MARTYKTSVEFPPGLDWEFLVGLEAFVLSLLPKGTSQSIDARDVDGDLTASSFSGIRAEVTEFAVTSWPLTATYGTDPTVRIYISVRDVQQSSVDVSGKNEQAVLGLTETIRRRIERGELGRVLPAGPIPPTASPGIQPPVSQPGSTAGSPVPVRTELRTAAPPSDLAREPSLMKRAFNHTWFVAATVGLVIAILTTILVFLSVKYH